MQAFHILRVLWAALTLSTVVFLLALLVIETPTGSPGLPLVATLAATGASIAALSVVLPRFVYHQAVARAAIATSEEPNPTGMPGVAKRRVATDPEAALRAVLPAFQTAFLLQMALGEAVAVFGFVLGFLGTPLPVCLGFFATSWVLAASRFPTPDKVLEPVERIRQITVPRPS